MLGCWAIKKLWILFQSIQELANVIIIPIFNRKLYLGTLVKKDIMNKYKYK